MSTEPQVLKFESRDEWLRARKDFITASDVAAILGFDKRRTAAHVYAEKRGLVDPEPDNTVLKRGRMLEGAVIGWYAEDTGYTVERHENRMEVHPDIPWLAVSRDATAVTPFKDRRNVEAKTARSRYGSKDEDADEKWGETGTDEVPRSYIPQTQIQMFVGGFDVTDVPVLIAGNDFRIYFVALSPVFIELAVQRLAEFREFILKGTPPPIDYAHRNSYAIAQDLFPPVAGNSIELGEEWLGVARDLENVRAIARAAEKRENQIKALIFANAGEAEFANIKGTSVTLHRNTIKKHFAAKPASERTEVHLKVKGLNDGNEDRYSAAAKIINDGTAAAGRLIAGDHQSAEVAG